jgi:broad specificity phosphatase PhoE
MTTTALLIRHAHTDAIGNSLSGRLPDIGLSNAGCAQVERLRTNLRGPLAAVYSSPLERALRTAAPLAADRRMQVLINEELNEIDFGAWTGMTFADLEPLAEWREFNSRRSTATVPGGERAVDVQGRILAFLGRTAALVAGGTFAVVSHCDVIRAAVLYYAHMSLDRFAEIDIDPASVTAVDLTGAQPRLLFVNASW